MTAKRSIATAKAAGRVSRIFSASVLALIVIALSSASNGRGGLQQPNKLLILSTSDVKGKTGPCG